MKHCLLSCTLLFVCHSLVYGQAAKGSTSPLPDTTMVSSDKVYDLGDSVGRRSGVVRLYADSLKLMRYAEEQGKIGLVDLRGDNSVAIPNKRLDGRSSVSMPGTGALGRNAQMVYAYPSQLNVDSVYREKMEKKQPEKE